MIARTLAAATLGAVVLATTTFGAHALWSVQPTASVPAATPTIATPTGFACVDAGAGWALSWSAAPGSVATAYEVTDSNGAVIVTTSTTSASVSNTYRNDTVRVAAVYGVGTGAWRSETTSGFRLQTNGCGARP